MTFNEEATLLYEYIVGGEVTTGGNLIRCLGQKYGMYVGNDHAYEAVFVKYGINYLEREGGRRGGGRGQHLGKYKRGYTNNKGQTFEITKRVIADYMKNYIKTGVYLEDYLAGRFNVTDKPQQPVYTPPQPEYTPPPANNYSSPANNYSEPYYDSEPSFNMPDVGGILPKLGGIAVLIVGVLLVYNIILKPVGNKMSGFFGGEKASVSSSDTLSVGTDNSVIFSNVRYNVDIDVAFSGKKSDMFLKKDYILCVGNDLQGHLEIGYKNGFTATLPEGYHDVWVQSGDKSSDVYRMLVTDNGTVEFECSVGFFGPKLEYSDKYSVIEVEKKKD